MLSARDLPPRTAKRGGNPAPKNAIGGEQIGCKTCPWLPRDAKAGVGHPPACRGEHADVLTCVSAAIAAVAS